MRKTTETDRHRPQRRWLLPLLLLLPAAGLQDKRAEFESKFAQAMTIQAKDEMARLIRQYQEEATWVVLETAEKIANVPSDALFEKIAALREGWKQSLKTSFVSDMEKYFSLMNPATKRERRKLRIKYDQRYQSYFKNLEEKNGPTFDLIASDFFGMGEAFERLGDKFYASQCFSFVGLSVDEPNREGEADLHRACEAYGHVLRLRDEIGLIDRVYADTRPRYMELVGGGFGPEGVEVEGGEGEAGADPGAGAGPIAASAPANALAVAFEAIEDVDSFKRPSYFCDGEYTSWNALNLKEKGSTTQFARMEGGPTILRVGSSEVQLDLDGDGEGDKKVPLTGKIVPVEFTHGDRPWAFFAMVGAEQDTYQGIQVNLNPSDEFMSIYMWSAASMVGEIAGTKFRVIDEDSDGIYGGTPQTWAYWGLSENVFQPEIDSIVVGDDTRARPWSEFVKVEEQWYQIASLESGSQFTATPVELKTGLLELEFKGTRPEWLILKGEKAYENSYFDITQNKKGVEVPVGRYTLFYGEYRKGKKREVMKTTILPGTNTPTWTVKEGETTAVKMGAPYTYDFAIEQDEATVTIKGSSVVVVGTGGERYERPWECVPRPEVSVRKAGKRKGSKPKKMDTIKSTDELYEGYQISWAPRDMIMEKKPGEGEVEVQLTEKKHKLFGKLSSEWKK